MLPCLYDEKQHEVFPSEILRWCQRNAPAGWKGRLFTYRHRIHGTFVVAVWASEKYGIFSDVLNLGYSLANFNRKKADQLQQRMWAPISASSMSRQINQNTRDYNSKMRDKGAAIKEENEKRRRGM